MYYCLVCKNNIEQKVKEYSIEHFGYYLCRDHQTYLREKREQSATPQSITLYLELLKRGIQAELEKFDGHKTIDIAVTRTKINIEVDGKHHSYSPKQAIADLRRTYYSFLKGYYTIRIPNTLIETNLNEAADLVAEMLEEGRDRKVGRLSQKAEEMTVSKTNEALPKT